MRTFNRYTLPAIFFFSVGAVALAGYYGGGTINHGHTTSPGDGGPLSNPAISGTATVTGISVSTLIVTGNSTQNRQTVTQSTITTLTSSRARMGGILFDSMPLSGSGNNAGFFITGTSSVGYAVAGTTGIILAPGGLSLPSGNSISPQVTQTSNLGNWNAQYAKVAVSTLIVDNIYSLNQWKTSQEGFVNITSTPNIQAQAMDIKGSTLGVTASAGFVGETISSYTVTTSSIGTSGSYKNMLAVNLTAGSWRISGGLILQANGATVTDWSIVISSHAGPTGIATNILIGYDRFLGLPPTATSNASISIPPITLNIPENRTYYLKGTASYTVAIPQAQGGISAVRIY